MTMRTLSAKYPKLRAALGLLALANQGVTNERYTFPKEAEDAFPDAERVLEYLTPEELETVVDGEYEEGQTILSRFGNDGITLDHLLCECFDGHYRGCSLP